MQKISVVMPLYNAEAYVKKTIDSILQQTYSDFEIIVVNDASTDRSAEIVREMAKKDSRIRLYSNAQNRGIAYTRNRAIELSQGEFIAIMDDDDLAPDYRLKDEVEFLENNSHIDIVAGNTCIIDENDNVIGMFAPVIRNPKLVKAYLMLGNIIGNSTTMIRREFIERYKIRYKDNMYGTEDYRFWAECSLHGNISASDKVMLYWRKHNNESNKVKDSIERLQVIQNTQRFLLEEYGFSFSSDEYELLFRIFAEEGKVESKEDIQNMFMLLQSIVKQAKELELDNVKEIAIMCRKTFGRKCCTAFFLWEEELL